MILSRSLRAGRQALGSIDAPVALAAMARALGTSLNALVFPWSCTVCGVDGTDGPFCRSCRTELLDQSAASAASTCPRCALPIGPYAALHGGCAQCRDQSLGFDAAVALGPYDGALKELCVRLKHEPNAWLARWLGELIVEGRGQTLAELAVNAWVVPIPLHRWRHWRRGYNQADVLGRAVGRRLDCPVRPILRRVRATPKLTLLSPTERLDRMRGAFSARPIPELRGRTVLLVDDVLTTGATCGAAARALKQAGADRVIAVVIARALKKH